MDLNCPPCGHSTILRYVGTGEEKVILWPSGGGLHLSLEDCKGLLNNRRPFSTC